MRLDHLLTVLLIAVLFLLQSSCSSSKFLSDDEYLLKSNEIILNESEKIDNKRSLKYELSTLYRQKVNGKFFFIPRENFYFPPEQAEADGKNHTFRKWINRVIAQPPVIFDPDQAEQTVDVMQRYLNDKGYYNAEVFFEDEIRGKSKMHLRYFVYPEKQLKVDTVTFESEDPIVDSLLQAISYRTLFQPGAALDRQLIQQEKTRISDYLRNNGYAKFTASYFPRRLEADTTISPNRAHVYLKVNRPYEDSLHRVFRVGRITVFPEYDIKQPPSAYRDTLIGQIHFRILNNEFLVRPQVILDAIYLKPETIYRQRNYDLTNQSLGNLSIYRFVRIEEVADSLYPQILNFRIELTPNKLNELGVDFELDYTNRSNTSGAGNLIGVSASPSLRNRNFLGGAEVFISDVSAGVEINPEDRNRFWNTIDFGTQQDLYLPRFRDYLGFWRLLNKISFQRSDPSDYSSFYEDIQASATTRIRTSFNYTLLLDFYRYNLLTVSYGYDYNRDKNNRYIINNLAIDYFNPTTQPRFNSLLEENPFLARSFGDQLFTSLVFREFDYVYNGPTNRLGDRRYLGLNIETAGAEVWALNSIYNGFANQADTFRIRDTDFSQYIRMEADVRLLRAYSGNTSLATRFAFGIARPFGFSTDVPYVKQFYVGGPNSIRGWPARSLGPGGFVDSLTLNNNNPLLFYQAGDLKLEFNLEYRFNIFWRLNGAVFLDGGNIWTVRPDPSRPESQFLLRSKVITGQDGQLVIADPFYKQIALGTGLGFRFDFTYFIFRLDLGMPLKYPYRWRNGQYWVPPSEWLKDINLNFSLGYPF
ncbi:MAG TPA: BamA/TamA family outer membrane protein [Saprospiraceae bacterium]|nr:BamA/TamA family outer membrane protein [Saprospiraceae bacterium]